MSALWTFSETVLLVVAGEAPSRNGSGLQGLSSDHASEGMDGTTLDPGLQIHDEWFANPRAILCGDHFRPPRPPGKPLVRASSLASLDPLRPAQLCYPRNVDILFEVRPVIVIWRRHTGKAKTFTHPL